MPPRAPSARIAERLTREGAVENRPDGSGADEDAQGQVPDLPDEDLRNETLATDRDAGTGLRPSSDPSGPEETVPEETLATVSALQRFESDLDALEASERNKLKRVESTVKLLKTINSQLEAAGQEHYLAELPLSRISRGLLQAHAGLADDRKALERFAKALTFLVRQMPYWKQFVEADHGSEQRPRRVRGWEALNRALQDIREGMNAAHESARNLAINEAKKQNAEKRISELVKNAQSDWNRMKFNSIGSLLTVMDAVYSRYFERNDEALDDEYIKFVVHNVTCLQQDAIPELEQLKLTVINLHEDPDCQILNEIPTKEALLQLVRSFNSPERQIDLAQEIVNLIREPHDFVTATQPSDVKLMDRIAQVDVMLHRLWDLNPKANAGFSDFLRSLPPPDDTLIQSPLRMVEEFLKSWKVQERGQQSTFVTIKRKMEEMVQRTKCPRHLFPNMNYPPRLLRSILVDSGAKEEIDAYAEHFRQIQVTRNANRGNSRGLTVAVASHTDTRSDVDESHSDDAYDDDDISDTLVEAIHAIKLKGKVVPTELLAALNTFTCDICGEKGHLQAQCPIAIELRQKIKELLQAQSFVNHSNDTLSRFFANYLRTEGIPFPKRPGYPRWNAASFRGRRTDTANSK